MKTLLNQTSIKFVKINRFTGRQTTRNENAIFEAFKENDNVEMANEEEISNDGYLQIRLKL